MVLGGTGLIGGALAARLSRYASSVMVADIRTPTDRGLDSVRVDIAAPGELRALMRRWAPDLIINAVNVATLFSQQGHAGYDHLIRFSAELFGALAERPGPVTYLQIGTTGSGGLGFDIPFTHGGPIEDMPIVHKAAFAGMMSQLLVMIARSFPPGRVRVLEVKPGLAIFATDRVQTQTFEGMDIITVDGGESGVYTRDELALLTRYMGFTTVDRIADRVLAVLEGRAAEGPPSGHDVTRAIDSAIVGEDAEDRRVRDEVLADLAQKSVGRPTLPATGNLGPPTITLNLTLAASLLTGPGRGEGLRRRAWDYLQRTQPGLSRWLDTQTMDLEAATRALEPHVAGAEAPWQVVHRAIEAQRR